MRVFRVVRGDGGFQTALHEISAALVLGVPARLVKPSVIIPTNKRYGKDRLCGTNHIIVKHYGTALADGSLEPL
jgi:hypothetical protein